MAHMKLLDWESKLFLDVMEDDGLLVLAKGLGLDRIFLKIVQTFCKEDNLVLVLNTISEEQYFYLNELDALGVKHLPKVITAEVSVEERRKSYLQGGVFFITSRILVVDMLTKRIPIEYITGMLVQRAHQIGVSSQEAFILRMFRESNCDGFVKGFSNAPASFTAGHCQVERIMKQLFVRKLHLRPRFHRDIIMCLEDHKPDVIELSIELSPMMSGIQLALLDLVSVSLRELKRAMPTLDSEQLTVENSMQFTFDRMLKFQLDPIWNELTSRTKVLVSDLKILRKLLSYLTNYDCITLYTFLETLRKNEKSRKSIWMLTDAANSIFTNAKARVLGAPQLKKSGKKYTDGKPESCPKWEALTQILDEIEKEENKDGNKKVLICTIDDHTCQQLSQVLSLGSERFLEQKFLQSSLARDKDDRETDNEIDDSYNETGTQKSNEGFSENETNQQQRQQNETEDDGMFIKTLPSNMMVMIHALTGLSDPYSILRRLYEFQPTYAILYDTSMQFVRQLEVYKASRPGIPLRVYFMFYSGSIEEQRYLTSLRHEKDAFELLIRQKAEMVIPEERQAKSDIARSSLRDVSKASDNIVNTRKSGGRETRNSKTKRVIVDMREFRSDLPSLLHRRGIEIEPVTLEVGDYILSPEICVERKSISDLIGSLNGGRLYTQCVSMTRFYKKPVLLIEFDETTSFSLQAKNSLKSEVSLQNISSKLSLLTIHFPKLRIIWSQSPHLTAEIFEDLKSKAKEPDAKTAMAIGVEGDTFEDAFFNIVPQDMVQKLPGINSKNYRKILNKYASLKDLIDADQEDVSKTIGNANFAKLLNDFVNATEETVTQPETKRKKF